MNRELYEQEELRRFHGEMMERERRPLLDRRDAKENLRNTLATIEGVQDFLQTVSWIINGSYGAGAYLAFRRLTKRMNRRAWLFNTAACLEYDCPIKFSCATWHNLSTDLQTHINLELDNLLQAHDEELELERTTV